MNRKVTGLLIGAGVGIVTSLIVLFLRGEKPRRFLRERFEQLRGALPEPAQIQQYARQAATRVSQVAGNAKDTTQQAMQKVKDAGSDLGEKVKQLTPIGN
jgi:gas vesicle protein